MWPSHDIEHRRAHAQTAASVDKQHDNNLDDASIDRVNTWSVSDRRGPNNYTTTHASADENGWHDSSSGREGVIALINDQCLGLSACSALSLRSKADTGSADSLSNISI